MQVIDSDSEKFQVHHHPRLTVESDAESFIATVNMCVTFNVGNYNF